MNLDQYWLDLIDRLKAQAKDLEPHFEHPKPLHVSTLTQISLALLTCRAILETLEAVAGKALPDLQDTPDLEMQALATEGAYLLETDQAKEDSKELDKILEEVAELGGFENLDKDDPRAQALAAKTQEICDRNSGKSEGESQAEVLQAKLKNRIAKLLIIKETKKVLREKFEEQLAKIDNLKAALT